MTLIRKSKQNSNNLTKTRSPLTPPQTKISSVPTGNKRTREGEENSPGDRWVTVVVAVAAGGMPEAEQAALGGTAAAEE